MPGKKITVKQIELYMKNRQAGHTQEVAAAKSGVSQRTGRRIENTKEENKRGKEHTWVTRQNPFADVWESDVVPMLKKGISQATFLLQELQKKYPGKFLDCVIRTLQRKMRKWRAIHGKEQEIFFQQQAEPGKLGISDFTHPKEIKVTINGVPFKHIFYHFRLVFSGFNYVQVFRGSGEPFAALAQGLQEALWLLGGVPEVHRTDSLSASFKNLNRNAQDDLTERYNAFVEHYGMKATRINLGKANENGAVESSHGHIKKRIEQRLIMRSSSNFCSLEEYRSFIQECVAEHNQHVVKHLEIERAALRPLPAMKALDYETAVATVSCTSTINVRRVTYSVPSRLIGSKLLARLYTDKLECYLGTTHVLSLVRKYSEKRKRVRSIDYRHLIGSLVKKPGAFRGAALRDDILPNDDYRYIWEYVNRTMKDPDACKFIVGLLYIAATYNCQDELSAEVIALIKDAKQLQLREMQDRFIPKKSVVPELTVSQHSLNRYNDNIPNFQGVQL